MAKTMRRIVITAILLIALAGLACFGVYACSEGTPFEGVRTSMLNQVLDATGMKNRIDSELRQRGASAAEKYGIPQSVFDSAIDILDIPSWKVVDSPNGNSSETQEFDYNGSHIALTIYDDPTIVTLKSDGKISTFGQSITFKLPKSAEGVTAVVPLVGLAEDIGLFDAVSSSQEAA